MLRINNINLPVEYTPEDLTKKIASIIKEQPRNFKIYKKSIDSRHKDNIHFNITVDVEADNEEKILKKSDPKKVTEAKEYNYIKPENRRTSKLRPVVVGFGPAGMFAALLLSREGLRPIVLERGADVDQRTKDVNNFWTTRKLNTESNVQFGEGGAGAFSDGKLNTLVKDKNGRNETGTVEDIRKTL